MKQHKANRVDIDWACNLLNEFHSTVGVYDEDLAKLQAQRMALLKFFIATKKYASSAETESLKGLSIAVEHVGVSFKPTTEQLAIIMPFANHQSTYTPDELFDALRAMRTDHTDKSARLTDEIATTSRLRQARNSYAKKYATERTSKQTADARVVELETELETNSASHTQALNGLRNQHDQALESLQEEHTSAIEGLNGQVRTKVSYSDLKVLLYQC